MTTRHVGCTGLEIVLLQALLVVLAPATVSGENQQPENDLGPHLDMHNPAAQFLARALAERERHSEAGAVPGDPGEDVQLEGWNETIAAVNPLNPQNVAYASLFELRVSSDGGLTWQDAVPNKIPRTHFSQGDPGLAFDANGRLFWVYFASPRGPYLSFLGTDIFIARCDPLTGLMFPGYPINVTASIGRPGSAGNSHDKAWLAVDSRSASPFANRLYLTWTNFPSNGETHVFTTYSVDQGLTWTPAVVLETGAAFKWPTHNQVAPNGDVFVAYHLQPLFAGGVPNGDSGAIMVKRSTNGGATFPQSVLAFGPGQADMTFNHQGLAGAIPGTDFWLQGSVQPWILTDPNVPGRIYVVANDDPDNSPHSGDAADVFIVRSTDSGLTWSAPLRVDHGPGTTFQVMPTAAIDPISGAIVVQYYDNRSGATNSRGNFLLDLYASVSVDGGLSFMPDFPINDVPFDPDAGARCRFDCGFFEELHDVWANPTGDVWAVGNTTMLRFNGVWQAMAPQPPSTAELAIIWGTSDENVYVTTFNEGLYHWNGKGWSFIDLGSSVITGVWGTSANDVFVGGWGRIWHFDGSTWQSQDVSEHLLLRLHGTGPNNVYAVGEQSFIAHYDGADWSSQPSQLAAVNPTERIGEYNGVAAFGGRSFAVWCGNTQEGQAIGGQARDQQAMFDAFDTTWQTGISIVDLSVRVPDVLLERVKPNPTRGAATVTYALPKPAAVDLALVDVQGRRLATLLHGNQPAGRHIVSWDGEQGAGGALPAGVYFVQLRAGAESRTERLTLLH